MKIVLTEEKTNQTVHNKSQYVEVEDIKSVRKMCPWAIMTYPYKNGHMAFSTVTSYSDWLKTKR